MILIVESGATKTDWRVVSPDKEPFMIKTAGMNLASVSNEAVEAAAREAVDAFASAGIAGEVVDNNDNCSRSWLYLYSKVYTSTKRERYVLSYLPKMRCRDSS